MGLFERIAASDLKFRLVLGPAAIVFAWSMVAGVWLFGQETGLPIGAVVGLPLSLLVGFAVFKWLP